MASRTELEAELEELRRLLAEARAAAAAEAAIAAADEAADAAAAEAAGEADGTACDEDGPSSADRGEFERLLGRLGDEMKDLHRRKPLLTTCGALVLGYVLGRAR